MQKELDVIEVGWIVGELKRGRAVGPQLKAFASHVHC